ncbi:MAG: TonB-dependent receptor [Methylococcaceae bacterium]|nr:MAG: TonB-dependent receptor [Methylococcaceae bacterium]
MPAQSAPHSLYTIDGRDVATVTGRCARLQAYLLAVLLAATPSAWGEAGAGTAAANLLDMPLNELMNVEIVSAASLLPTQQAKAPGTVYSFTRTDFERMGIRRLDDLLAYVPGLQLAQHRKRHRSIWARGLLDRYNDKMVLLVDGVRRQHLYYGNFSLGDNFPLEKIEKVEIILGPASALYGANAFGGIISVTTRDFTQNGQKVEATVEGGDNARYKGTLQYNSERLQAFASVLTQDAPFRDDRKSFIGGNSLQPLDEEYANAFIKASPFEGMTLLADYYRNNTPFLFIPDTQNSFVEEDSLTLQALYEVGDLDKGKIQANFYYTRDNAREHEVEQITQRLGYEEQQNAAMAGGTVTGFKRLFDDHVLALGLNWMHSEAVNMDTERRFYFKTGFFPQPVTGSLLSNPNIANDDVAVFFQDVWNILPQLNLTLGGRYDQFEQFGGFFNYRAALVFSPDDQQTWKLLYGTAIRTPTFREYLKVLEGTDFIPPIPKPERIESVELGYGYHWQRANINLTLFHNTVSDTIHETPTPDDEDEYFANSGASWRMLGAEAVLQYKPLDSLDLRLSGALLNAENQDTGRLPYLASWNGSFLANYNYVGSQRLGFSLVYSSSRPDTNGYAGDKPAPFLIANVFGSGNINAGISYNFGIDNVFNSRVYDPAADFGGQYNIERSEREIWLRFKWNVGF